MLTSCASFAGGCSTGWAAKGSGVLLSPTNSSSTTTVSGHDSDDHFLGVSGRSKGWQGAELSVQTSGAAELTSGTPISVSIWVQPAAVHPALACSSFVSGCTSEWSAGGAATIAAQAYAAAHDGDGYVGLVSGRTKSWEGATLQIADKSLFISGSQCTVSVYLRLPASAPASTATFSLRLRTRGSSDTSDFMQIVATVASVSAE